MKTTGKRSCLFRSPVVNLCMMDGLSCLDDLAGLQAPGARTDSLRSAAHQGANRLKIRIEAALGPVIGVAHPMTELRPFAAYVASFRHWLIPPTGKSL
jgi:hypothetical protein